ncbi:MAG: MFS transporter [Phycisphaerae bacterium]|nr:MFS transporter [Phycisphaerae bacterium]
MSENDLNTSMKDVKQLGMVAAIGSLSYVFWICGGMEMIERLAFYGVKAVAALYATDAESDGGLGVTPGKFGIILMSWALVQSILPVFTGGLSDRYGYKRTIFASTVIKIIGYLIMAWFCTYWGFFAGALVLAAGTAVFKPGIQGTLVKATNRQNSSMAWGIFYQTVNIGGFMGPLVAGLMRKMQWPYVFYSCAAIISINFLLLLTYKEVGKEERLEQQRQAKNGEQESLLIDSLNELRKPHVWIYLAIFSGFWFMFNSLFDVLPLHIDDWVNSKDILGTLFADGVSTNKIVNFFIITNKEGTQIKPEGMLNVNAGMIMITCFFFAWISGKMRATTSMVVGTLLSTMALFLIGASFTGWACIAAIAVFSLGEMLSSPKFSEYIGNIAPNDKKAMYLGFSQIPLAIGWTLEGFLGPWLYGVFASKDTFSRDLLKDKIADGSATPLNPEQLTQWAKELERPIEELTKIAQVEPASFVDKIPQGEAFDWLVRMTGEKSEVLTTVMYNSHDIAYVWYIMGVVGIISAIGIWIYGKWILTLKQE